MSDSHLGTAAAIQSDPKLFKCLEPSSTDLAVLTQQSRAGQKDDKYATNYFYRNKCITADSGEI